MVVVVAAAVVAAVVAAAVVAAAVVAAAVVAAAVVADVVVGTGNCRSFEHEHRKIKMKGAFCQQTSCLD